MIMKQQYEHECDRVHVPMVSGAVVDAVLRALLWRGQTGWELVSTVTLASGSEVLMFFKRAIPDAAEVEMESKIKSKIKSKGKV